jgi:hypothetical protein
VLVEILAFPVACLNAEVALLGVRTVLGDYELLGHHLQTDLVRVTDGDGEEVSLCEERESGLTRASNVLVQAIAEQDVKVTKGAGELVGL